MINMYFKIKYYILIFTKMKRNRDGNKIVFLQKIKSKLY